MQFQTPISIADALEKVESGGYLIPAIQREFVWKPHQIERLFDSIMREYPIGGFLFWEVEAATLDNYPFYGFSRDIRQGGDNHRRRIRRTAQGSAIGILDGQQRLTAFLVGLTGTYTAKGAQAVGQQLHLNLLDYNEEAGEEELAYQFSFKAADVAQAANSADVHWMPVSDVLRLKSSVDSIDYLGNAGIRLDREVLIRLERLRAAIHDDLTINYYLERRDDLAEVLNVFVRLNRGGTALSYPDLLLSAATLGWKKYNAQEEFKDCVTSMNSFGFDFERDRVLKAALVMADLDDIKFKAANFKSDNAITIERNWAKTKKALVVAAELLASFGLESSTLTAKNAMIPVAHYLQLRQADRRYVENLNEQLDRERVRTFVLLTLLKSSFWTGSVDQVLLTIRTALEAHGKSTFPLTELKRALGAIDKPLTFTRSEIDLMLAAKYGGRNTSLILSMMYPVDLSKPHHQDHVVPKSSLTPARLKRQGIRSREIARIVDRRDRLPNLQLLPGYINVQKSRTAIDVYVRKIQPAAKRAAYIIDNDLGTLPNAVTRFSAFFEAREVLMRERLLQIVDSCP